MKVSNGGDRFRALTCLGELALSLIPHSLSEIGKPVLPASKG
jgi:hypothetical protein